MDSCERTQEVGPYHDDELPPAERLRFEAHLAECAACAHELEVLRGLSRLLAGVRLPAVPTAALARVHEAAGIVRGRAVVRFAEVLTAAAAVIIAACATWLWQGPGANQAVIPSLPGWQMVAAMPRPEAENPPSDQQVAEWMVNDLTPENGND